jgi:hypothetical protein
MYFWGTVSYFRYLIGEMDGYYVHGFTPKAIPARSCEWSRKQSDILGPSRKYYIIFADFNLKLNFVQSFY